MTTGYCIEAWSPPHGRRFCSSVEELLDFVWETEVEDYTRKTGKTVDRESLRDVCEKFWALIQGNRSADIED